MIRCFMLQPTARARRTLRRHQMVRRGYLCLSVTPLLGHPIYRHEATAVYDEIDMPLGDADRIGMPPEEGWPTDWPWPERCANPACPDLAEGGYAFQAEDPRLVLRDRLYEREDDGALVVLSGALPPGAVYDVAPWVPAGRDRRSLVVVTPDGKPWYLDAAQPGGETFVRLVIEGERGLTASQTSGDPWPWVLDDGAVYSRDEYGRR